MSLDKKPPRELLTTFPSRISNSPLMAASDPPPRRAASAKRKYDHAPVMRVEKQFRNAEGAAFQVTAPPYLQQPTIIFQARRASVGHLPNTNNDASRPSSPSAANEHTFVINTIGSMKRGPRTGKCAARPRPVPKNDPEVEKQQLATLSLVARKITFRPSRPLKNAEQINSDIWQTILGYCEPKLLLEAKTINSEFYRLLSDRSRIWRESRLNHFGPAMPDCPAGLTEQQYVDLLVGRGCQNRVCPRENTARVYWTFQVRLCAECFRQKTIRADDLPPYRRHVVVQAGDQDSEETDSPVRGRQLCELLPMARSDGRRYLRPRSIDTSASGWAHSHSLRQYVFLKSVYADLDAEYRHLVRTNPGNDAVVEWLDDLQKKLMTFMIEATKIESWYKHLTTPNSELQHMRAEFFEAHAAALSPPMDAAILWNMAAFRRILKVQGLPTERSWKTLKEKILPYRSQAEQVEEFKLAMAALPPSPYSSPAIERFRRLHEHRSGRKRRPPSLTQAQVFVLKHGQREFARCLARGVADADLLLMCLKNVFDSYAQLKTRPVGLNFDGTTGPYCLSLDDARMIVEDAMEKQISRTSQRGMVVFANLKCRGCRRTDFVKTWSFTDAFEHMLQVHAKEVGEGLEFWQFAKPYSRQRETWVPGQEDDKHMCRFPWYTVPWPRCLPLVPGHQDTSKLDDWHPAISDPFVPLRARSTVSAFKGRRPRPTAVSATDFSGNLIFAAKTLNGTWLDDPCQMKIALKYALDLDENTQTTDALLSAFKASLEALQHANPSIDLRFRCGSCMGLGKVYHSARQVKHKIAIEGLLAHWDDKHEDTGASWTQGLMHLPTDSEVLDHIADADQRLQEERVVIRERTAALPMNHKKRPKLKSKVVMQARLAREAFDELYPPHACPGSSRNVSSSG